MAQPRYFWVLDNIKNREDGIIKRLSYNKEHVKKVLELENLEIAPNFEEVWELYFDNDKFREKEVSVVFRSGEGFLTLHCIWVDENDKPISLK